MDCNRDQREIHFHNNWAESTSLSEIKVYETFENITAQENRFILGLMGNLNGVRILDVGAGLGESSVYFALKGAKVTANDISPGMLTSCKSLAAMYGVEISTQLGSGDTFDFGKEQFDIVYGANILHHLEDLKPFLKAVKHALVPGGRFFFYDPIAYNPAINLYRHMATTVRTVDERPLRFSQLKIFNDFFDEVHHREFWLASLVLFFKYFLVDRIHPSTDRYWKRILNENAAKIGWWFKPLLNIDNTLLRIPPFHYLAWNTVIWGK